MKYLISITAFVILAALGTTLLASQLIGRYGNVRKVTELTKNKKEIIKVQKNIQPTVTSGTSGSVSNGNTSVTVPSVTTSPSSTPTIIHSVENSEETDREDEEEKDD
ncbi:MAG: hypothetical protein WCP14_03930 [bacterium]